MLNFDREVAAMPPRAFTEHFIADGLRPAAVVVGEDFRYGRMRAGDTATLTHDLAAHGIDVHVVPQVADAGGRKLGSTAIRHALSQGDVARAAKILGRYHAVEGEVVRGAARGRTLGFRTANVCSDGAMLPMPGVYAVQVSVTDPASPHFGALWSGTANVGSNPTFADGAQITTGLEVHILDQELGDTLYGTRIEVGFVARLRDERKFSGPASLVEAIEADIARAREELGDATANGMIAPAAEDLQAITASSPITDH